MALPNGEAGGCASEGAFAFGRTGEPGGGGGGGGSGPRTSSENVYRSCSLLLSFPHPPFQTKLKTTVEREDPSRGAESAPDERGRWPAGTGLVPDWGPPAAGPSPYCFSGAPLTIGPYRPPP